MSDFATHPYAGFLTQVTKPARYTGGEVGAVRKDWSSVDARVCLAFPDIYDIGMSHLGFKILYKILNDDPRTLAERAYCPWVDMEAQLRERDLPLISLESYRPLRDFDVVGFSLQFELTYTNVLTMLDLGGISLRASDRREDEPLVVAGGPNATHPEAAADFFDAIVIGDGEAKLTELALRWTELKEQGLPRAERLRKLADLGAVYVPSLYEVEIEADNGLQVVSRPSDPTIPFPVLRSMVNINDYPFPADSPTGGPEAIFDRTSIEITRGCTEGCRFCQAGMIYRPVQERDPEQVYDTVKRAIELTGNDEVSLTALSTADVSYINPLIKKLAPELAEQRVSLSVSSLRAYGLEPELMDELKRVRAGGLTFAPEAGTQRMRDVVNKNVTEAQLHETAERIFARGYQRMKLYFMIGLPTEQDEDVIGIVETGIRTAKVGNRAAGRRVDVTVSVSTHVPKPHTPFQWAAMDDLEEIDRKHRLLRQTAGQYRPLKLKTHDSEGSVLEGILARGDRRLSAMIERAWRNGARFDSWDEQLKIDAWQEAIAHFGVEHHVYLGTLPVKSRVPWDHIDVGLEDGFLAREYRRALKDRLSPPCGKAKGAFVHHTNLQDAQDDARKLICYDCGVACDMTHMREERLVFLRKLGADKRPEAVVEAEPDESGPRLPPKRDRPKVGDPHAGERFRLRFEKSGPMALLGHLDIVRELPRIFRRVGQEQIYTGGFNPKPQMTFSPALSLGVISLGEYVDLRLDGAPADEHLPEMLEALNAHSPMGLRFTGITRLGPLDPPIGKVVDAARYLIVFSRDVVVAESQGAKPEAWLEQQIASLMARESAIVHRKVKGIHRTRDVRAFLKTLRTFDGLQLLERAGLVGDLLTIEALVRVGNTGSAKVREIAQVLFDTDEPPPHQGVRLSLLSERAGALFEPLDLEHLRVAEQVVPESGLVAAVAS